MTEAEAKTKWCPLVRRPYGSDGVGINGGQLGSDSRTPDWSRCVGSACMAWRETHKETSREDHSGARDFMNTAAMRTGRHVRREGPPGSLGILILDAVGYCGAFGEPR